MARGWKTEHANSLWRELSSLPGVSSHERVLDFEACAILAVPRKINLAHMHGLHTSSRLGAGPRIHPIALYR